MRRPESVIIRLGLALLLCTQGGYLRAEEQRAPRATERAERCGLECDEITVAVVDSGLGGLSVVADLERRWREARSFRRVELVFFNALFSSEIGYNSLRSREEKIRIFDKVLAAVERHFRPPRPDLILVACNTLSALVADTAFAAAGQVPIRGIIEPGVRQIETVLRRTPEAPVIIFATRTTVAEDSHRAALAAAGHDVSRVLTQACPELADTIERGVDSEDTELLIATFVDEALERLDPAAGPVYASLGCSHYPYAERRWRSVFREFGAGRVPPEGDQWGVTLLNPNREMADLLIMASPEGRFERTETTVSVVSKVEISEQRRRAIGQALRQTSVPTADALLAYERRRDLF